MTRLTIDSSLRNASINHNETLISALCTLLWRGNAQKFQQEATRKLNEFFASGITIEDIALLNIRDAFDGKVNHIKYEIAKDIDAGIGADQRSLIPDLLQKYVTTLATAGVESKPTNYTDRKDAKGGKGKGGKGGKGQGKGLP